MSRSRMKFAFLAAVVALTGLAASDAEACRRGRRCNSSCNNGCYSSCCNTGCHNHCNTCCQPTCCPTPCCNPCGGAVGGAVAMPTGEAIAKPKTEEKKQ